MHEQKATVVFTSGNAGLKPSYRFVLDVERFTEGVVVAAAEATVAVVVGEGILARIITVAMKK